MRWKVKTVNSILSPLLVISMLLFLVAGALTVLLEPSPTFASPDTTLSVTITSPAADTWYSTEQQFDVEFTVSNTGGEPAIDVYADMDPGVNAEVVGDPTQGPWNIPVAGSHDSSYTLKCTGSGSTTVNITASISQVVFASDSRSFNQENKTHLKVVESDFEGSGNWTFHKDGTPQTTFSTCQNFTVMFIVNNIGEADALGVTVTVDPGLTAEVDAHGVATPVQVWGPGDIPGGGNTGVITVDMHCNASGPSTITITPAGNDTNTGEPIKAANIEGATFSINQQNKTHLKVVESDFEGSLNWTWYHGAPQTTFSTCQNFTLKFTVNNTGEADALDVTVTVDPGLTAEVDAHGVATPVQVWGPGNIPGGTATPEIVVDMHCNSSGPSTITITPAGNDTNTGEPIKAANIEGATFSINQQNKTHLKVVESDFEGSLHWTWYHGAPQTNFSSCQHFDLMFMVNNTGQANATAVTVTVDPGATAEVGTNGTGVAVVVWGPGDIPGLGSSGVITVDMHCNASGPSTITITPAGTDENTNEPIEAANIEGATFGIDQEWKAHLEIVPPESGYYMFNKDGTHVTGLSTCQHFDLKFRIHNSGEAAAEDVTVTVEPNIYCDVEAQGPGIPWTSNDLGTIYGDGYSDVITVDVHYCAADICRLLITPAGNDTNTKEPIPDTEPYDNIDEKLIEAPPPMLEVETLSPDSWIWLGTCQDFAVSATVTNIGGAAAIDVVAFIDPGDTASLVSPGVNIYVGTLKGGESEMVTWTLHCDEPGKTIITINAAGTDNNTGLPIDPVGAAWSDKYGDWGLDEAQAVAVDSTGNVTVTGYTNMWHDYDGDTIIEPGEINYDYYTKKYGASGILLWEKFYDSGRDDYAYDVAIDPFDNSIIVTGKSWNGADWDYLTMKYNSDGTDAWLGPVTYDGGYDDEAHSVAVDPNSTGPAAGDIIVTGFLYNYTAGNYDYCTIKYNPAGGVVWGPIVYDFSGYDDYAYGVAIDPTVGFPGDVIVTGYSWIGTDYDYVTMWCHGTTGIRYSWVIHTSGADDYAQGVAVDPVTGEVVVTGYSMGELGPGAPDYWTVKYPAGGGLHLWEVFDGTALADYAYDVAVDPSDGSIIVTGKSWNGADWDYLTIKYNGTDGAAWGGSWPQTYDTGLDDEAHGVAVDNVTGDVVVTGWTMSGSNPPNYLTIKYNATGVQQWSVLQNSGPLSVAEDVAVDSQDNAIVTGYIKIWHDYNGDSMVDPGERNWDYLTIKYDEDGNIVTGWPRIHDTRYDDEAYGVAVDSGDNIIVTGHSWNGANWDYLTIKYGAAGNVLPGWPVFENFGYNDFAYDVAVDSADNVIVTGVIFDGYSMNYCTVKYSPYGAWLWAPVIYDSSSPPTYYIDYANGVAVDSADNIVVTGWTTSGSNPANYLTIKYDSTGTTMAAWPVMYDGGVGFWDEAYGVAVDLQDNIIVTGSSWGPGGCDYLTIKYDPDGDEIWSVPYDSGQNEKAYAVAVDSGDNIIVTGTSYNATPLSTTDDYLTIKYDPDGNPVTGWPVAYDSGKNDYAYGVAVDSGDNVIVTGVDDPGKVEQYFYTIKYHTVPDYLIVQQYAKAHLVVDITVPYDGITYATCQTFDVIATVTNTGWADAWEVKATISISPEGSARLTEGGYTLDIGTLTGHGAWQSELPEVRAQASAEVSWTLHCKQACSTTITVTAEGKDEYGYQTQKVYVEGYYESYSYYQSYSGFEGYVAGNVTGDIQGHVYYMDGYFSGYIEGVYFAGYINETIHADVEGYVNGYIRGDVEVEGYIDGYARGNAYAAGCDSYYGFEGYVDAYVAGDIEGMVYRFGGDFDGYFDGYVYGAFSGDTLIYVDDEPLFFGEVTGYSPYATIDGYFIGTINGSYYSGPVPYGYYSDVYMDGYFIGSMWTTIFEGLVDGQFDGIVTGYAKGSVDAWVMGYDLSIAGLILTGDEGYIDGYAGVGCWLEDEVYVPAYEYVELCSHPSAPIPENNIEPDSITVKQLEKPHLRVEIVAPNNNDIFSTCQDFYVKAKVYNDGEADALDVTATIDLDGNASIIGPLGELWHRSYDGGGNDIAFGVATDSENNIIVTGSTAAFASWHTVKYDPNGTELWNRTYNSTGEEMAWGVATDSEDNIIVTGWAYNVTGTGTTDYYTIKYDKNGTELWNRSYDGGGDDGAYAVAVDSEDNIIVTGISRGFSWHIIKYYPNGTELWNKTVPNTDVAYAVATDSEDNIIVTGPINGGGWLVIKYYPNGTEWWNTTSPDGEPRGVATDSEDNIIVTGGIGGTGEMFASWYTIKYDKNGTELWNRTYSVGYNNCAFGVATNSEDNIIVAGYVDDGSGIDLRTIMYDPDGVLVWQTSYESGGEDAALAVATDSEDNIIVTGASEGSPYNYLTIKYGVVETQNLGDIPGGGWAQVIWDLHCTDPGDSEITVTASGYYGVPRQVDVFLLVDLSMSMWLYMDDLAALAEELVDAVTAIVPDAQFGVGSFVDFPFDSWGDPSDYPYLLVLDLTSDGDDFVEAVENLTLGFGWDGPESQYEALYQAATGLGLDLNGDGDYDDPGDIAPGQNPSFRDNALKIIILATDAGFHNAGDPPSVLPECPGGYPGASRHATVDALRAADIKVIGLEPAPYDHIAQLLDVVDATGGELFVIDDVSGEDIADVISIQANVVDPSAIPITNIEHDQIIIHQVTAMAHLVVDISYPENGDMFYKGDEFLVTAMVSNTGYGNATGVNVTISWDPDLVSLVTPGLTQTIDIPAGESKIVTWTLVAGDTEGYTVITVTATGPNTAIDAVTVEIDPPPTIVLYEGVNPIVYTGETASLPAALTNISDKLKIIWQRDESTGGAWHYFYFYDGTPMGNITELVNGTAYIVVVTEDCTWEVLY